MWSLKLGSFATGFAGTCFIYYQVIVLRLIDIHKEQTQRLEGIEEHLREQLANTLKQAPPGLAVDLVPATEKTQV
ncbi:hypothetical protein STCU_12189 [Strigomonas culicis]|uniref:Uncharacterized protein n=1 Tax=Strigomonas culicis TaxID=28005 RepID=S9TE72_9TRYP|nr:hypothetical protein STCU_12189 [Strigomonas culicis]|eukprot:EPY15259.1 hypothetical protein STCU_12189 [Strigomonas culicis]